MLRQQIEQLIEDYVTRYQTDAIRTRWNKPLVAYTDAADPRVLGLKTVVHPDHFLPTDVLPDARTIVCYFLPFDRQICKSNVGDGPSSSEWNYAYVETNAMFELLNRDVTEALTKSGCAAAYIPNRVIFDPDVLKGRWSHRHLAEIAGLGTFGLSNMLITEQGCGGRYNSFLIAEPVEDAPRATKRQEACLYKRDGSCGLCADRCPAGALTRDGFDRSACDRQIMQNRRDFPGIGVVGTCGKCVTGLPCTFRAPYKPA